MQALVAGLPPISRALSGTLFVSAGLVQSTAFVATAGELGASGLPHPSLLLASAIGIEVVGGAMLAFGPGSRFAALLLAAFLAPVTVLFHPFWSGDPASSEAHRWHFLASVVLLVTMLLSAVQPEPAVGPSRPGA